MTKQILKTVLAGILAGIALFILPFFFIRVLIFFLLIGAIFRLMGGRRRGMHRYAFAHKFQNMSEEERKAYMEKYGNNCCGYPMHKETVKPDETVTPNESINK